MKEPGLLRQSGRFAAVGILNTLLTWGVTVAAQRWFLWPPVVANAVGYSVGLVNSYWWNSRWTFRARGGLKRFLLFAAVTVGAYLVQLGVLLVLVGGRVEPVWAQGAAVAVGATASFALHRGLTFRRSVRHTAFMEALNQTNTDTGRDWVVGAVIANARGELYFHRRTWERKLFPGCWDIVGGHVERGETVLEALGREIREETGWTLKGVSALLLELDWSAEGPEGTVLKHEFDFIVEVEGDLEHPLLETGKHDRFAWVSRTTLDVLRENRQPDDQFILDLAERGFAWLADQGRPPPC